MIAAVTTRPAAWIATTTPTETSFAAISPLRPSGEPPSRFRTP
jgi:hypothetical protein